MKLADHVEHIRKLIDTSFRNRLGRMGVTNAALQAAEGLPAEHRAERQRIEPIRKILISETGSEKDAYEKLVEEFTFTLFNRLAALKVMEAHTLHPEIVTRRSQHGDRSFAHKHWLEQNPDGRNHEMEGMVGFIEDQLVMLAVEIPLFSPLHPYHLLPTAIELHGIIDAFNQVDADTQVETDIWKSDDVLGWLYESYNNYKKAAHKESGDKTEFNKVSIQSQVYTPRWVVKFLMDNSLGKLYLEMYPDSDIKNRYKIANAPKTQVRTRKPLTEIKLMDPATGSGNFLLYGFDLFYELYLDVINEQGNPDDYEEAEIPKLIIGHNLHGIDLDDRAIQLAQLGLYIKAKRKKRSAKIDHFNIVSSDFFLPAYSEVRHLFEGEQPLSPELEKIVTDLWEDLQQAYKFGALIRLEEKFSLRLHELVQQFEKIQLQMFSTQTLASYENFRETFFTNLQKAVTQNTARQGQTFLNIKTQDAITFLQLLTRKYDVAVANPPYTDSADFGPELKKFIDGNFKQPYKFNSNLYACFIKRCCEITNDQGYVALIHPHTFMFIKTFEDVRKYILEKTSISLFVEYGQDRINLFDPSVSLDAAFYILSKSPGHDKCCFIRIGDTYSEREKKALFLQTVDSLRPGQNELVFAIDQSILKIIAGWPFIYWISDDLRAKFKEKSLSQSGSKAYTGVQTGNNEAALRFIWEIPKDEWNLKPWILYSKGGPFNKWFGNLYLIVNWQNDGGYLNARYNFKSVPEKIKFKEGYSYSASGSKGISFRYLPPNTLFDIGGSSIIPEEFNFYKLGLLNSILVRYFLECLNPTVNTQAGDINRIPFIKPSKDIEDIITALVAKNVAIKKELNAYRITEIEFQKGPLLALPDSTLKDRVSSYCIYENAQLSRVLLQEAIINQLIFNVYALTEHDKKQVETKMGKPVGDLPVLDAARQAYLADNAFEQENVRKHIEDLAAADFEQQKVQVIQSELGALYQTNNDLEEFCIRYQVNPINVWYWFKEARVLPPARAAEIALEFLADAFRTILKEDQDGIVPLVGLPGEPRLMDRLEQFCFQQQFSSAQFMQLDGLTGHPIDEYIGHHFFDDFSNLLNLFRHLPKTPFIWHLSSGENQGFEAYISIYKWNRDSLYKLKSGYLGRRTESLQYRLQQIGDSTSAQAQTEKEMIHSQIREIDAFARKIDELLAEGYDPKLDDGVGKNIAPLQKKGMLQAEVLKSTQLQKYINADW